MRALFLIVLLIPAPVFAQQAEGLVGIWKLVSWQIIVDNQPPPSITRFITQAA